MTQTTVKSKRRKPEGRGSPLDSAPRQPLAQQAWKRFAQELLVALRALDEDEYLILKVKGTNRFVQFMDQGAFGMRGESVSDYYLPDGEHLDVADYRQLLELGWHAPTMFPGQATDDADGSPNYHIDLAPPVPLENVAVLAVLTLVRVHRAGHPGRLEYVARSGAGQSIRFPNLGIRQALSEA
jgi:hypothetical protein